MLPMTVSDADMRDIACHLYAAISNLDYIHVRLHTYIITLILLYTSFIYTHVHV